MHPTKTLILRFLEKNPNQTIQQVSEEVRVGYTHTGRLLRDLWKQGHVTESFTGKKSYWRVRHAPKGSAENGSVQGGEG
jgi:predicted HTH transcriptional regulator